MVFFLVGLVGVFFAATELGCTLGSPGSTEAARLCDMAKVMNLALPAGRAAKIGIRVWSISTKSIKAAVKGTKHTDLPDTYSLACPAGVYLAELIENNKTLNSSSKSLLLNSRGTCNSYIRSELFSSTSAIKYLHEGGYFEQARNLSYAMIKELVVMNAALGLITDEEALVDKLRTTYRGVVCYDPPGPRLDCMQFSNGCQTLAPIMLAMCHQSFGSRAGCLSSDGMKNSEGYPNDTYDLLIIVPLEWSNNSFTARLFYPGEELDGDSYKVCGLSNELMPQSCNVRKGSNFAKVFWTNSSLKITVNDETYNVPKYVSYEARDPAGFFSDIGINVCPVKRSAQFENSNSIWVSMLVSLITFVISW